MKRPNRLSIERRLVLAHAWVLSMAIATGASGNFALAIDQLAYALPCAGSGVLA